MFPSGNQSKEASAIHIFELSSLKKLTTKSVGMAKTKNCELLLFPGIQSAPQCSELRHISVRMYSARLNLEFCILAVTLVDLGVSIDAA